MNNSINKINHLSNLKDRHTHPDNEPTLKDKKNVFRNVSKHPRYLNDWNDDVLIINVSDDGEEQIRTKTFDLKDIWLPPNHPLGPFKNSMCLTMFPHWITILKLVVNETLHINKTMIRRRIQDGITIFSSLFSWSVLNGVYQLKDLKQDDFKELAYLLAQGNWYQALNMDTHLSKLLESASTNKSLLKDLVNTSNSKGSLNVKKIRKLTGIPLSKDHLSRFFYKQLHTLSGVKSSFATGSDSYKDPLGITQLNMILTKINLVFNFPNIIDKPATLPFPNATSLAKSLCTNPNTGRTKNLTPEDAIKLLGLAIEYVYDYAPGIIALGNDVRSWLENNSPVYTSKHSTKFIHDKFLALKKQYSFPVNKIEGLSCRTNSNNKKNTPHNEATPSFMDLIHSLQTACMKLIAMNHGRRKNEILGEEHLPYGIYYGCISEHGSILNDNRIDIYVEKTIRDWCQFSCNQLVVDSVTTLEETYNLFRPLNTDPIKADTQSIETRRMKLFRHKRFSHKSLNSEAWSSYNYYNHSGFFLYQAGICVENIDHTTHPYRRFFCIIYYYRYENPMLIALQEHLKHESITNTRIYVTDPVSREYADSIEALFRIETNQLNDELKSVGREYLKEKISEIINEKPTGGGLSKTAHALYKHLLKRVEFRSLNSDEQTEELSNEFLNSGYEPTPFKHGICMLSPKCNQSKASCYKEDDKRAHKENACLKQCMKCRYNFDNENYLESLKKEANELRAMATDFSITTAERLAYQESAINLDKLIQLEVKIQIKNAEKVTTMKANAYLVWGINDHLNISIKNEQRACINNSETESLTKHQQ